MQTASSQELLKELFWRSSLRVAVLNRDGQVIMTSKAFRDSFPGLISLVEDTGEVLEMETIDASGTYSTRIHALPPGESFSCRTRTSFAGVETEVRIETTALRTRSETEPLFLTEWYPEGDENTYSKAVIEIEQKYRNLQENLPVGIYRAAEDGILITANGALIRMMGFDSFEELQNVRLKEVWVDPGQRNELIERLRSDGVLLNYQVNLRRKNGEELVASFDARGTFDAQGRLVYFDTIVQDITDRIQAKRELERLARTDSLTGLFNRQYLWERLEEEISRAMRYRRPLAVILMDLDHFKDINDSHGHLAGDAILLMASSMISDSLRKTDFAGRYGGEEFCIVMPETKLRGGIGLAQRIRKAVEGSEYALDSGETLSVTCSMGVAEACSGCVEEIVACADEALYRAKRAGRNMVSPCLDELEQKDDGRTK